MRTWGLRLVVLACLVAIAFWLRGRAPAPQDTKSPQADTPSAKPEWSKASNTVNALFQAASEGDDRAYLELLDGGLRRSLEQTRSDLGAETFRENLRRSAAGIKGVAVTPDKSVSGDAVVLNVESVSGDAVVLNVELVFADRNENQEMRLVRRGNDWKIASIEAAKMVNPVVPYGTSVFEQPSSAEPPPAESSGEPKP